MSARRSVRGGGSAWKRCLSLNAASAGARGGFVLQSIAPLLCEGGRRKTKTKTNKQKTQNKGKQQEKKNRTPRFYSYYLKRQKKKKKEKERNRKERDSPFYRSASYPLCVHFWRSAARLPHGGQLPVQAPISSDSGGYGDDFRPFVGFGGNEVRGRRDADVSRCGNAELRTFCPKL